MPSIASHFSCASLVAKKLDINNDDFYRGNILPDLLEGIESHYKIDGTYYLIPNIDYYKNHMKNNYLDLGYLCHLLLDKYFLEEYIPNNIKVYKDIDLFVFERIYTDYTNMNKKLIDYYNLDIEYINKIMKEFPVKLDQNKYNSNLNSINHLTIEDDLKYINFETYLIFLDNISSRIAKELKEIMK